MTLRCIIWAKGRPDPRRGGGVEEGAHIGRSQINRLLISQLAVFLLMTACAGATPTQLARPTPEPMYTPYPTPTVIAIASPTPTLAPTTYVVQPGDTLASISAQYGITAEIICAFNTLADCNIIHAGQELLIPPEGVTPTIPTPSPTPEAPTATPIPQPPTPTPTLAAEIGEVVKIVDGDTIDVQIRGQTFRIRYIGMNTPETGQPCAAEATNYNSQLVAGKTVTLIKDVSETDQYGRLLQYVYVGDIFVNAELVRQGYANAFTYPPDVAFADLFVQLEAEARAAGRGCWAAPPTPTSGTAWNCVGNIYNCSDFSSCAQVMSYWYACPGDPSRLDGDNDGIPCEVLCQ